MFPDIGNLMYDYKMQCVSQCCEYMTSCNSNEFMVLHDKDFTAKYFRHEIYAGDSDACGLKAPAKHCCIAF